MNPTRDIRIPTQNTTRYKFLQDSRQPVGKGNQNTVLSEVLTPLADSQRFGRIYRICLQGQEVSTKISGESGDQLSSQTKSTDVSEKHTALSPGSNIKTKQITSNGQHHVSLLGTC